jgi:hypothetical protein
MYRTRDGGEEGAFIVQSAWGENRRTSLVSEVQIVADDAVA